MVSVVSEVVGRSGRRRHCGRFESGFALGLCRSHASRRREVGRVGGHHGVFFGRCHGRGGRMSQKKSLFSLSSEKRLLVLGLLGWRWANDLLERLERVRRELLVVKVQLDLAQRVPSNGNEDLVLVHHLRRVLELLLEEEVFNVLLYNAHVHVLPCGGVNKSCSIFKNSRK